MNGYKLRKLADVAEKYGDGTVHLSVRMSPEILYINMKDINNVIEELGNLWHSPIATCGSRVHVLTDVNIILEDGQIHKNLLLKRIKDILVLTRIINSRLLLLAV